MAGEMVMRSVYLRPEDDTALRELAFTKNVTKNDLIRSAVAAKLQEWRKNNNDDALQRDLTLGQRVR